MMKNSIFKNRRFRRILLIIAIISAYCLGGVPIEFKTEYNVNYEVIEGIKDYEYNYVNKIGTCKKVLYSFTILNKCDGKYVTLFSMYGYPFSITRRTSTVNYGKTKKLLNPIDQIKRNITVFDTYNMYAYNNHVSEHHDVCKKLPHSGFNITNECIRSPLSIY